MAFAFYAYRIDGDGNVDWPYTLGRSFFGLCILPMLIYLAPRALMSLCGFVRCKKRVDQLADQRQDTDLSNV